jgi:hypothetical protein
MVPANVTCVLASGTKAIGGPVAAADPETFCCNR